MPLFNLTELPGLLVKDQRLIGIDPGCKSIGLALSDVRLKIASPYGTLRRDKLKANAAEIEAIARKEGAGGLVVGLPLSMDGSFGPAAQAARDWALALSAAIRLPAAMWDERLSSSAVNRFMVSELDLSRSRRTAGVDRIAAAWMLQSALDSLAAGAPETGIVRRPYGGDRDSPIIRFQEQRNRERKARTRRVL